MLVGGGIVGAGVGVCDEFCGTLPWDGVKEADPPPAETPSGVRAPDVLMLIDVIRAIQDAPLKPGKTRRKPSLRSWPSFS